VISAFDSVTAMLPTASAGVSVTVNGIPAPIYFARADQVNVQIPYEVDGQQAATITVNYNGVASSAETVRIAASVPRLYPGIFNQDGSLNSAGNPAPAGSIVVFYATGQGATSPPSGTGRAAAAPYPSPVAPVRVTIGGQDVEILFAGLAPATAGVMQVNARIPEGIEATAGVALYLSVGNTTSQKGVTLAVR
jgi:uncharacterized protein (TIGR03437 family)